MTKPSRAFWSGKRVLLTGHTGFKGAWSAIWLSGLGARVSGLALAPKDSPNLFEMAGIANRIGHHCVDLRDSNAVRSLLAGQKFDIVIHMAAQALVRASIEDPVGTFATNVMGTANLLDELRDQSDLQAIVVITSDKVYSNNETGGAFTEGDPLGGKDPYSASKAAVEITTSSFAHTFFKKAKTPVATARGGNVIGGGDFSQDRIMADVIRAALAGSVTVLRHPDAVRPWQHVLDCLAGYFVYTERLATVPDTPRAMNFGPRPGAQSMSVGELATRAITGLSAQPWRYEPDDTSIEARNLAVDTRLARDVLGFQSRLNATAAVDWTVDWHRRQACGESALKLCEEQIARYEEFHD